MELNLYLCEQCGNLVNLIKNSGIPLVCCRQKMVQTAPDSIDISGELQFYYCEDCKNMVILLKDSGVPFKCCGCPMIRISPNTEDASLEKHVPIWKKEGSLVQIAVGAAEHPMEQKHFIEWILLKTKKNLFCKTLLPGETPAASFSLSEGDEVEAVYAFCNLHGLWAAK